MPTRVQPLETVSENDDNDIMDDESEMGIATTAAWSPRRHSRVPTVAGTSRAQSNNSRSQYAPDEQWIVQEEHDDETPFFHDIDYWLANGGYHESAKFAMVPKLDLWSGYPVEQQYEEGFDLSDDYSYSHLSIIAEGTSLSLVYSRSAEKLKITGTRVPHHVAQWRMRYSINGEYTLFNTQGNRFLGADFYGMALAKGRPVITASNEHSWALENNQYIVGDSGKRVLALQDGKPVLLLLTNEPLSKFYTNHKTQRLFILVENAELYFKTLAEARSKSLLKDIFQTKLKKSETELIRNNRKLEESRRSIFLPEPGHVHLKRSQELHFELSEIQQKACSAMEKAMKSIGGLFLLTKHGSNFEHMPFLFQIEEKTPCESRLEISITFQFPYSSTIRNENALSSEFAFKLCKHIARVVKHPLSDIVIHSITPGSTIVKAVIYNRKQSDLDILRSNLEAEITEITRKLMPVLKLNVEDFNSTYDFQYTESAGKLVNEKLKHYQPDKKFTRIGLKVNGRYEDDEWCAIENISNQWTTAFHGFTLPIDNSRKTDKTGFEQDVKTTKAGDTSRSVKSNLPTVKDENQLGNSEFDLEDDFEININQFNERVGKKIIEGLYFTSNIETSADKYVGKNEKSEENLNELEKKITGIGNQIIFLAMQVRVDATKVQIPESSTDYRLICDPYYVRPHAIIIRNEDVSLDAVTTTEDKKCCSIQ